MIVGLGHGISNSIDGHMLLVGINDSPVHIRMGIFQPASQCGAKIKVDVVKIFCFRIRAITFSRYFFVEVGIWGSSWFYGNLIRKWVFSWGLIEMTVQTEVCRG